MKVGYLFQNTFRQILSRKAVFALSAILLCITFLIIFYQAIVVGIFFRQKHMVKSILAENLEDVYILDFTKYAVPAGDDDVERLNRFGTLFREAEGIKYAGICYKDGCGMDGVDNEVMAISFDLLPLCQLKNEEGDSPSLEAGNKKALPGSRKRKEGEKIPVLVGYHLREDYPIGHSFTDSMTSTEYVVTDILQEGSRWFEDSLGYGSLEIDLDDCLIVNQDARMKRGDGNLNGMAAFVCVMSQGADVTRTKETMVSMAAECGLDLYNMCSVKRILEKNKELVFADSMEYYLVMVMLVLAVIVSIVCSMINVFLRKRSIGVMYAVGYSMRDIQWMVLLENMIKIGMAFSVAYAYWRVNEMEIYGGMDLSILDYILPWLAVGTGIVLWVSSIFPIQQVSKLYPATLIGGKE